MDRRYGFIGKTVFLFGLLLVLGATSTSISGTTRTVVHSAVFLGLIAWIVRPRSSQTSWPKQIGVGIALFVLLFGLLYFLNLQGSTRPDGTRFSSLTALFIAIGGTGAIWTYLSYAYGNDDYRDGLLGSAKFGGKNDIDALANNDGDLIVGRGPKGQLLRYDGPAHLITIAPTRSGKGVGTIIPNLLTAERSVICIDPKGENARVTGRKRAQMGPVYYLDPFALSGHPTARYNPLASLSPDSIDLAEDAMTLADALVYELNSKGGEEHWNEEAKALLSGIILYTVCHDAPKDRHLGTVREYLTLAPNDFQTLLTTMQASIEARGLIARAANRFLGKSDREAAGVLSSAQRHTHFLDSPRIEDVVSQSDFTFAGLKKEVATVFLILPPDRLDTYARWLRLLLAQGLGELARSPDKPERPVLFLLDEFAALGKLEAIERAMGLMAGYGLQLWPILQDVHQLRSLYSERAGTFISNAGVMQAFGVNDFETAEMLSKTIGKTTVRYVTTGESEKTSIFNGRDHSVSTSEHLASYNLMDPDEIMKLEPSHMLLMQSGKNPLILCKIRYFEEKDFAGMFDEPFSIGNDGR